MMKVAVKSGSEGVRSSSGRYEFSFLSIGNVILIVVYSLLMKSKINILDQKSIVLKSVELIIVF